MNLTMFAVYDKVAEAYSNPFYLTYKGEAVRIFADMANDPKTKICVHRTDFSLFKLAEFDDHTGKITPLNQPEFIINATDFEKKEA